MVKRMEAASHHVSDLVKTLSLLLKKSFQRGRNDMVAYQAEEGVFSVCVAIVVATFGSLIAFSTVCAEQNACLNSGTCYTISDSSLSCAFKNSITPPGWRLLNLTDQTSSLQLLGRGVCAPGMRQSVDPVDGRLECVRKRSYPNALTEDIGDSDGTSDHQRWCGGWIDSGSLSTDDVMWAFFDEKAVEHDVEKVLKASGSSRLGVSDVVKFRSACRNMATTNSEAIAGKLAFEYLDAQLRAVNTVDDALEALGFLTSHFCDAPATVGLTFDESGFLVNMGVGVSLGADTLREALYGVDVDSSTRDYAAEFADAMESLEAVDVDLINSAQAELVVHGSHSGTWLTGFVGPKFSILYDSFNIPLARFIKTFERSKSVGGRAYLRGIAAYCSFAARSVVTGEFGGNTAMASSAHTIQSGNTRAVALGRVRGAVGTDRLTHVDKHTMLDASTGTLSSLSSLAGSSHRDAHEVCLRAARVVFPDDFDHVAFDVLVTERLYGRLETINTRVRDAASEVLSQDLIGSILSSNANRAHAVKMLRSTRMRVAGAPRGSWAGVSHQFTRPEIGSDDGAVLIMMKQARAVFLDRMYRAVADLSVCEHPPVYDALERNAYLLSSHMFSCGMVFPGILVPPFADERYDDASIYSRIGYILAHEYLHVTWDTSKWDTSYVKTLLVDYEPGTEVEAIADAGAIATIMSMDVVDSESLCGHVSQMWCGRRGWLKGHKSSKHPKINERGDAGCNFLRRHFA